MTLFAVRDALGEYVAVEETADAAAAAGVRYEDYLDGAATCGHPAGPRWAAARLPVEVEEIPEERAAEIRESLPRREP